MKKIFKILLLSFLSLGSIHSVLAQEALFSMDVDEGCGILVVQFINSSTGAGELSYSWNFGNGILSPDFEPQITYTSPGTYTVLLEVTDDNGVHTYSDQIIVHPYPEVNFSADPLGGCAPVTAFFTDASSQIGSDIVDWSWNFGDGSPGSGSTVEHTFNNPGSYHVILTVEDGFGCTKTNTYDNYINVSEPPAAAFTIDPSSYCNPTTVQFTNNSFGYDPPLGYEWDFGDGGTSSQMNPNHFFDFGTHVVHLTVTDASGCSNATTGYVQIDELLPEINVDKTDICIGEFLTFENSDGGGCLWNFGDGTEAYTTFVGHSYVEAGTYNVVLSMGEGSCLISDNVQITVHPSPEIDFSTLPEYVCSAGDLILNNQTVGGESYIWNIYTKTYNDTSIISTYYDMSPEFYISHEDLYIFKLEAVSEYGCSVIHVDSMDIVFSRIVNISQNPLDFCIPFTTNLIPNIISQDEVVEYEWSFEGDFYSNLEILTDLTIVEPGIFQAVLTIETEHGCTDMFTREIKAGTMPEISFYTVEDTVCMGAVVEYVNTSPDSAIIDFYSWSWNSIALLDASENQIIAPNHTGNISLTLKAYFNLCENVFVEAFSFYVTGPYIASLDISYECESIQERTFEVQGDDIDSLYWDFGDGSDILNGPNMVQHTYLEQGTYSYKVVAHSDHTGCDNDTLVGLVHVYFPEVNVVAEDSSCSEYSMYIIPTLTADWGYVVWDDDVDNVLAWNSDTVGYVEHTYVTGGLKEVLIIGIDQNGCRDTTLHYVNISYVNTNFTFPNSVCLGNTVTLEYEYMGNFPLQYYTWTFGVVESDPFYENADLEYEFTESGVYEIELQVVDSFGCEYSSEEESIIVQELNVALADFDDKLCLGEPLVVEIDGDLNELVSVDFGDASPEVSILNHTYQDTGSYNIELHFENEIGCTETLLYDSISVQKAYLDIFLEEDTLNCYPESPVFIDDDGKEPFGLTYQWSDNLSNTSELLSPEFVYTDRGFYSIRVIGETENTCKDTLDFSLVIDGPYADIEISDHIVCKNDTVEFEIINDTNIVSYTWTLGDGFGISNTNLFDHSFMFVPDNGRFEIVLSYPAEGCDADGDGQNDIYSNIEYINIYTVVADFDLFNAETNVLNDTNACSPLPLRFFNKSSGDNTYTWKVNEVSISDEVNVDYYEFSNNISYYDTSEVALFIESIEHCKDTVYQKVVVKSVPDIELSEDAVICLGETVDLWANGGDSVEWTSKYYIENPSAYNINIEPDLSTTIYAKVTSRNACENEDSIYVFVQPIPELYTPYSDTLVIVGQEFELFSDSDQEGVSYSWTPALGLSCTDCPSPEIKINGPQEYIIEIKDSLACHSVSAKLMIDMFFEYTLDMPNSFTPNDDGENDIVWVRGWGIKDLLEFKIYNRWGEQIFFSNDLKVGWDGTYNGKPQNIDSYAYMVRIVTYNDVILSKKGTITLIR